MPVWVCWSVGAGQSTPDVFAANTRDKTHIYLGQAGGGQGSASKREKNDCDLGAQPWLGGHWGDPAKVLGSTAATQGSHPPAQHPWARCCQLAMGTALRCVPHLGPAAAVTACPLLTGAAGTRPHLDPKGTGSSCSAREGKVRAWGQEPSWHPETLQDEGGEEEEGKDEEEEEDEEGQEDEDEEEEDEDGEGVED